MNRVSLATRHLLRTLLRLRERNTTQNKLRELFKKLNRLLTRNLYLPSIRLVINGSLYHLLLRLQDKRTRRRLYITNNRGATFRRLRRHFKRIRRARTINRHATTLTRFTNHLLLNRIATNRRLPSTRYFFRQIRVLTLGIFRRHRLRNLLVYSVLRSSEYLNRTHRPTNAPTTLANRSRVTIRPIKPRHSKLRRAIL